MNKKTYRIALADGTVLDGLRLNGNNFISGVKVDEAAFDGNCSPVVIEGPEDLHKMAGTHPHMELVQVVEQFPGEWWFILRDIPETELAAMRAEAQLVYTAMMTDTLLDSMEG